MSLLSIPAKTLRAGATLTPDFMVRNLIRDAVDAGMLSRSGFVPGVDSAKGLKSALKHDDRYWAWVKAGGDQATLVSMDRTSLQKDVNTLVKTGYADKLWNMAKNPLEALRLVSEISEQTTRIGEFGKATQVHGTDKAGLMQAALESRDLMDFARRGRLVKNFNMMTAFFNAQLQGLDRISRGLKENPKRTLARAAAYITIPSIYLAIKNYGDERIQEIPRAQRDISWVIPVGDALVRLPKPYESGVMFGSFFERTAEFIMDALTEKHGGDINKARAEAYRGFGKSLLDITKPTVTPNFLQPLIEHFANRSTVFDRPIVPAGRENMLPEYQYAPYTLELTKALSRVVGSLPGVDRMNTFSPSVAENYIRAWTGGLGMYAMQALDAAGRKTGILPNPVQPIPTLADTPFVRAFVIRHPQHGGREHSAFPRQLRARKHVLGHH